MTLDGSKEGVSFAGLASKIQMQMQSYSTEQHTPTSHKVKRGEERTLTRVCPPPLCLSVWAWATGSLEILRKASPKFNVKGKRAAASKRETCEHHKHIVRLLWLWRRERRKIGCLTVGWGMEREREEEERERRRRERTTHV